MLVQISFGLELGLLAALVVFVAISLASVLPITPGRIGIFEAAVVLTYQFLGVPASQALALAIMIHAAQAVPFITAGYIASLKLGFRRKDLAIKLPELGYAQQTQTD